MENMLEYINYGETQEYMSQGENQEFIKFGENQEVALCLPSMDTCLCHQISNQYHCQNCRVPACQTCVIEIHYGHQIMLIQEAFEAAKFTNVQLNHENASAIVAVKHAMENIHNESENVQIQSGLVEVEIRNTFRNFIGILEAREQELLSSVDQTLQGRASCLDLQMQKLTRVLNQLVRNSVVLRDSADCLNTYQLIDINDLAEVELAEARSIQPQLLNSSINNITFVPPSLSFINSISNLGEVSFNPAYTPTIIEDESNNFFQENWTLIPGGVTSKPPFIPQDNYFFDTKNVVVDLQSKLPIAFSANGKEEGQISRPWGICCNQFGQIIVADRGNHRIQVFSSEGKFQRKFGQFGYYPGDFKQPTGIALNPDGNIIVSDKDNHRIQIFTITGTLVLLFGSQGSNNGQLSYPWGVACNSFGQILVCDSKNHRIQLFSPVGAFLQKFGSFNNLEMWRHLDTPRGACFTPNGDVVLTDLICNRLMIVKADFSKTRVLGTKGKAHKQFERPQGVCCDDDGNIIVVDGKNSRIQVLTSKGEFIKVIGKFGEMDQPNGVCLSPEGRVIVVDHGNSRIQIL